MELNKFFPIILLTLPVLVYSLRHARIEIDPDINIIHFVGYYTVAQIFMFFFTLLLAMTSTLTWSLALIVMFKYLFTYITVE